MGIVAIKLLKWQKSTIKVVQDFWSQTIDLCEEQSKIKAIQLKSCLMQSPFTFIVNEQLGHFTK